MKVRLKVWRQRDADDTGGFRIYETPELNPNMSFLEMLDVVNEGLTLKGEEPIAFDHDCREGICGTCSLVINGKPHGPHRGVATCQTYMRSFSNGAEVVVEPFRARPFPVVRDLVVDRAAFDRIIQAGGFISVRTGSAPDANAIPVPKPVAEEAMDAAQCIGCLGSRVAQW
jgi:succinate dehydrogenase / fumarate reductase, iron-sulfur subunit